MNFWKPPCLIEKARLNAQEGTHPQPRSELEGASPSIVAARFASRSLLLTTRAGSRLSTSRCGFGMSCMHPVRSPSEAGVLPPSRRQDPGLGGGLCVMQDTPNSYLEAERRESFLGILGRGLGRSEDFAFVDLCRPGGSWPPFVLGRAPLTILQTCAWHDFVVRFCSFRVVAGAALRGCVEIHCSGHIFRSPSVSHFRRLCSRERCSQMCTRVACR